MEPAEKRARIHYGSIEEAERQRIASGGLGQQGNIFQGDIRQTNPLTGESQAAQSVHAAVIKEMERKKRARSLAVPTEDKKVKLMLRELDHPICLFGEQIHQRRERLTDILSKMDDDELAALKKGHEESDSDDEIKEEFFTEGTKELKEARLWLAGFSLPRAKQRIKGQLEEQKLDQTVRQTERNELEGKVKRLWNCGSQVGDERPLSYCRISNDAKKLVTGSWSGGLKLWDIPSCNTAITYRGHNERVGGVDFHPFSGKSLSADAANFVSGASDGSVRLWSLSSPEPLGELVGHRQRVSRVAYHPSGRYIGTASFDSSWRLWDAETQKELLLQEGHFMEVYGIAFHPDGSLAATCGLDCISRIWDLRLGRSVQVLEGHVKQVLGIDFSPNGYTVATGSEDNTIRIWDLRKRKPSAVIPAHQSIVSQVKFEPTSGHYLVSSSFDKTLRVWSSADWKPIKTLAGHENKVMSCDVAQGSLLVASCSYDRTFKLWEEEGNW